MCLDLLILKVALLFVITVNDSQKVIIAITPYLEHPFHSLKISHKLGMGLFYHG